MGVQMKKKAKIAARKKTPSKQPGIRLNTPDSVAFDYIKSNFFRVIHIDGVHGGISPKLNMIQMALFSERQAIPQSEKFALKKGQLGEIESKKTREAIIREVEVEALMDIDVARALRQWLDEKIQLREELISRVGEK
jgi:hypothetical protein